MVGLNILFDSCKYIEVKSNERGLVVHLADPAMQRCCMDSCGVPVHRRYDTTIFEIPKEYSADLWFSTISSLDSVVAI